MIDWIACIANAETRFEGDAEDLIYGDRWSFFIEETNHTLS